VPLAFAPGSTVGVRVALVPPSRWPLAALAFDLSEGDVQQVAPVMWRVVEALVENNVPHNLMVRGGAGARAFVFARAFEKAVDAAALQVAGQEVCGHFIVPSEERFQSLTGGEAWALLASRSSAVGDRLLRELWRELVGGGEL